MAHEQSGGVPKQYMTRQRITQVVAAGLGILLSVLAAWPFQTSQVDDKALKNAAKGAEWLTYGMDYSEQRYSTMTQINPGNVARLAPAWSYEVGTGGGPQAATPLYANGVIYGVTNWSITFAVDAATGKEIWRYDPKADRAMTEPGRSRLCCGVNSRGISLYEGKVIIPVIDGRLQAVDAKTGKLIWSALAIPKEDPGVLSSFSITMAPRVANGKVFIGNAGAEFPPYRGYVSAFDVNNGMELWRFYTVPGDPSKPFESKAMADAAKTWTGEWWKQGGGGSYWDGMAYDPDANLVYAGTGNGAVWSQDVRQGKGTPHLDNLYIASIVALNADTGELKWHYQCTPGDQWDYDAISHLMLATLNINGRERKVLMQANKNGFFYVIDRLTGEFISAAPMAPVNWTTGIDPKTGRPAITPEAFYTSERGVTIQPIQTHNTSQMAFNPAAGLVYVPIAASGSLNLIAAESFTPTPGSQNFGTARGGRGATMVNPPTIGPKRTLSEGSGTGILSAWDPVAQKERWFVEGGGNRFGGAVSTASNLVFQITPQGRLRAYTADKGERLLDMATGETGGMGPPITYMHNGKQYVAVMGGNGQVTGSFGLPAGAGRGQPAGPPPANPRLFVFALP
jgi:PQQ-dependent dehydrogenase (methanol/ethanol family)